MTTTWVALVAALGSLSGVILGSMLEPIKLAAARRARAREQLADRCAQFVEAAIKTRSRSLLINRFHRKTQGGHEVDQEEVRTAEKEYWQARDDLLRLTMVLHLTGPCELADRAEEVRHADYRVRDLHKARGDLDGPSEAVQDATDQLDASLKEFMDIARRNFTR